jgi:DNA-binding GntR family transcriptional regulator
MAPMAAKRNSRTGKPHPVTQGAAPRLYERAQEILRARLRDGQIPAGERLYESRIAAEFGISRAPARRALAELATEGLIRAVDGRGYEAASGTRAKPDALPAAPAPIRLAASASWSRIYKEVETEIVARIAFGTWRVVESDLARYHGVSRTVARDVLARLQQYGIVKKDDKSRWHAPGLTRGYVTELYEMRRVLEPTALLAAAAHLPRAQIRALRVNLEAAIARADELDGAALDRLEAEMHVELLSRCPNRTLLEALGVYQSLLIAHSFLYRWGPQLYASEPFLPEHLEVAERLEGGHVREAASALERHMRLSLDRALARIDIVAKRPLPPPLPYLQPAAATAFA